MFRVYSKVIQLYIFSIIVYDKILNTVPRAIQQILLVYLFIYGSVHLLIPYSRFIPPRLPFPFGNHKFVFYVCVDQFLQALIYVGKESIRQFVFMRLKVCKYSKTLVMF